MVVDNGGSAGEEDGGGRRWCWMVVWGGIEKTQREFSDICNNLFLLYSRYVFSLYFYFFNFCANNSFFFFFK